LVNCSQKDINLTNIGNNDALSIRASLKLLFRTQL